MAKKSIVERNLKRELLSERYSEKRELLKLKIKDKNLSLQERFSYAQQLDALPVDGSKVRYKRRCVLTQRARGLVDKKLGISRIMLRELVGKGQIPGVRKSSW